MSLGSFQGSRREPNRHFKGAWYNQARWQQPSAGFDVRNSAAPAGAVVLNGPVTILLGNAQSGPLLLGLPGPGRAYQESEFDGSFDESSMPVVHTIEEMEVCDPNEPVPRHVSRYRIRPEFLSVTEMRPQMQQQQQQQQQCFSPIAQQRLLQQQYQHFCTVPQEVASPSTMGSYYDNGFVSHHQPSTQRQAGVSLVSPESSRADWGWFP